MLYQNELIWLAQQMEQEPISKEPSLWQAIRQGHSSNSGGSVEVKRHVYITGDPQIVYKVTDLFQFVTHLEDIVTLTNSKDKHPALQWMDITYVPPTSIDKLPKNKTVTLFTENRLPLWSRVLFVEEKICNVVATENIVALSRMPKIRLYLIDDFNFQYLLDDVIVTNEKVLAKPKEQLHPEVPKQYILLLMSMNESAQQKERQLILNKVAANMLNMYWLQNHPPLPQWMPILLREIKVFLEIKQKGYTNEKLIKELKVWGSRDKRIN